MVVVKRARGGAWVRRALVGALVVAGAGAGLGAASRARGTATPAVPRPAVITGETPHRHIHFTFDDGPDPATTPRLLDVLDRAGMKATFFFSTNRFVGRQQRNQGTAELAREIVRRGHTAGSHSFEHQRMGRMSVEEARVQISRSERELARVLGAPTRWFRPPFGSRNAGVDRLLADGGYTTVMWNIGMADWVERPAERIVAAFWHKIAKNEREGVRGGIVLMHDTHSWSVDAFERIVASITERNCGLVARGEEPYDLVDSLEPFTAVSDARTASARIAQVRERVARACAGDR